MPRLTIIGAGLSGSEAAWQAAQRGIDVTLVEMRPLRETGAHTTARPAELVCSNSLGSNLPDRASGLLKEELRRMGSLLIRCADETAVPAGGCLAVDREGFPARIEAELAAHPRIRLVREEATAIPDGPCILASGPLTSPALADALAAFSGSEHLFFYDAISPIVEASSVDMTLAFRASRREQNDRDGGDYINCPMNREEYDAFVRELVAAERIQLESFESAIEGGVRAGVHTFFEGCLPVEIIASRGPLSLAYGPMRPVGLEDPRTGRRPFAVLQLRQDNLAGTCYNLVGFQTNLKFPEQQRVFAMVPGLGRAEYLRFGQMHRNTFINAPRLLRPTLQTKARDDFFMAGQITGVEGYAGNIATGLLAGVNAAHLLTGRPLWEMPETTMLGALMRYVTQADEKDFQPMKANFGIVPPVDLPKAGKRERATAHMERSLADLAVFLEAHS
ncbi:MAG: methylenetetrahydrofolate--tRNA-(uracil(54)-C(5))-methyltransferase (FADH(2)-oxidizing) TrmFO [Kiritimatiellia bacterium]